MISRAPYSERPINHDFIHPGLRDVQLRNESLLMIYDILKGLSEMYNNGLTQKYMYSRKKYMTIIIINNFRKVFKKNGNVMHIRFREHQHFLLVHPHPSYFPPYKVHTEN